MKDLAVCIVTFDRSPRPNYLSDTLASLDRSGTFGHPRLHSFWLIDSGSRAACGSAWPLPAVHGLRQANPDADLLDPVDPYSVLTPAVRRSAKQNTVAALRQGAASGADWVLHLEDDLLVCGDFLGSVGRWLDRHADPARPLFIFSGDNGFIQTVVGRGGSSWEYPVEWFWGFQAFACRPPVARDLAQWLEDHPIYVHVDGREDVNAHDLEAHRWAAARGEAYFRGSCPVFVQHIGHVTSIDANAQGGAKVHFPTFPGEQWVYR